MKKILITAAALALLAVPALAAQQDIAQISAVTASREALRTAINTQLSAVQSNFDEVYAVIDAGPVYVNTTAPADTKVVWIDTDQDNAIKVYVGGVWTVVGGGGSYTLPTAAADTLGGVKVGDRLSITDGVLSADVQSTDISGKQDTLVSGTNIKTINSTSLLGSGNIDIAGGGDYTLPIAAADTLGGVKVGSRLTITDGVLSADVQSTDISGKENVLGNPVASGYVLSSTDAGVRSWVAQTTDTDTDTLGDMTCTEGQIAKMGSSGWECDADAVASAGTGDDLGDASAGDVVALFSGTGDYLKTDGTKGTPAGDNLGSATYSSVVGLWTTCTGYLKSDGTCDSGGGSMTYPGAGVPLSTGSAWGTSYTVGTAANNLVKLNASAQLPAVSAALLTNFPTLNQNTTGTAGGLSGTPNITIGTISAGAAGFNVDADGDVTAKSVTVTRTTIPSAIDLYEGTSGGDNKLTLTLSGDLPADAALYADQILVDGDIGSTVQAYDADLTTAAGAGAAGVNKYFGTNASSVVGFYDLPSGGGTPTTITVADTTDTTAYVALFDSATGDLGPKTDTGITYNAGTGMLTATGFTGPLTGTASGNLVSGGAAGTPSSITLTNGTGLPISGLTNSTSAALGLGSINLGHASDTTIARSGAGVVTVEGVTVTRTIASGTAALGTAAISSGACATAVSATATGTATTDTIGWGFSGDPTSTTGYQASANGMLTVIAYPTSGNVNFKVCNNTAASVTPGAVTLNWKVFR